MLAWFKKKNVQKEKPATENANCEKIAHLFVTNNDKAVYRPDLIAIDKLDFSYDSLELVDEYLISARKTAPTGKELQKLIACSGSYLGEVLRRKGKNDFNWYTHENAAKKYSPLEIAKPSMATMAVLSDWETFLFPYAVVCECIEAKTDKSVYKYAFLMKDLV